MNDDAIPFTDLLFNLLLGYAFLFIISFLLIQPIVKKAEVSTQAEFIITVTWPADNSDDIDTWLEDPLGNLIWFRQKENGLMHIDRDDIGSITDTLKLADGTIIIYPYNQEITTIRGFVPGEWILNIHVYRKREKEPTLVKVTVDKLNPTLQTIILKEIEMVENWEEVTVARFEMTGNGEIMSIDDLPKRLVKAGGNYDSSGGGGN